MEDKKAKALHAAVKLFGREPETSSMNILVTHEAVPRIAREFHSVTRWADSVAHQRTHESVETLKFHEVSQQSPPKLAITPTKTTSPKVFKSKAAGLRARNSDEDDLFLLMRRRPDTTTFGGQRKRKVHRYCHMKEKSQH